MKDFNLTTSYIIYYPYQLNNFWWLLLQPASRPVGKASPVVNNQQQSRKPPSQTPTSSKTATATISRAPTLVAKLDSRKTAPLVEKKAAPKPQVCKD